LFGEGGFVGEVTLAFKFGLIVNKDVGLVDVGWVRWWRAVGAHQALVRQHEMVCLAFMTKLHLEAQTQTVVFGFSIVSEWAQLELTFTLGTEYYEVIGFVGAPMAGEMLASWYDHIPIIIKIFKWAE
jgi:hypothetical protein